MWFVFALATTLIWGTAELFYKKGARPDEQYSHLKIGICVGAVMGLHAMFTLLTQDINYNPININVDFGIHVALPDDTTGALFQIAGTPRSIEVMESNKSVLHVHTCAHLEGGTDQNANLSRADFGKQFLLADFGIGFMDKRDLLARDSFRYKLFTNIIIDRKGRIISVIVPVEHSKSTILESTKTVLL